MSGVLRRLRPGGRKVPARKPPPNFLLVGVLATVAILLATAYAFTKSIPFTPKYKVEGLFSSGNQLVKGSPVRIAGVDVGRVTGISKGPGEIETTAVEMEIKKQGQPLHTDAVLRIRPRLFLEGGFYVDVNPGSPSAPELESGDTIPLPQTRTTVQFNELLSQLDTPTRDDLRTVLEELGEGLDGAGARSLGRTTRNFAPVLRDLAIVSEAARGTEEHDLSNLIRYGSRVTAALASRDSQLADLVTGANRVSGALASQDAALAASVRELDGVLRASPPALAALDRALPPLRRVLTASRPALQIAPPVLERTSDLLVQLQRASGPREVPALLRAVKPLFAILPPFVGNLRKLLVPVRSVADCIRERVTPVLKSDVKDGALSTGQPVWMEFAHGNVGLTSLGQSFDGNGFVARAYGAIGANTLVSPLIPDVGRLVSNPEEPILGSRPTWLGQLTPAVYQPGAECKEQTAPNLQQPELTSGGPPAMNWRSVPTPRRTTPSMSARELRGVLREAERGGERP